MFFFKGLLIAFSTLNKIDHHHHPNQHHYSSSSSVINQKNISVRVRNRDFFIVVHMRTKVCVHVEYLKTKT